MTREEKEPFKINREGIENELDGLSNAKKQRILQQQCHHQAG